MKIYLSSFILILQNIWYKMDIMGMNIPYCAMIQVPQLSKWEYISSEIAFIAFAVQPFKYFPVTVVSHIKEVENIGDQNLLE